MIGGARTNGCSEQEAADGLSHGADHRICCGSQRQVDDALTVFAEPEQLHHLSLGCLRIGASMVPRLWARERKIETRQRLAAASFCFGDFIPLRWRGWSRLTQTMMFNDASGKVSGHKWCCDRKAALWTTFVAAVC
jgi:hypothetical protein